MLITADGFYRRGKIVRMKEEADQAVKTVLLSINWLSSAEWKSLCLGQKIEMLSGRKC